MFIVSCVNYYKFTETSNPINTEARCFMNNNRWGKWQYVRHIYIFFLVFNWDSFSQCSCNELKNIGLSKHRLESRENQPITLQSILQSFFSLKNPHKIIQFLCWRIIFSLSWRVLGLVYYGFKEGLWMSNYITIIM